MPASDDSALSSDMSGYTFKISSKWSAICVFRPSCPSSSLVTWLSQFDICSKNLMASSSVCTASASACRLARTSLGGSSNSILIFFTTSRVATEVDGVAGSSSRCRLELEVDSGGGVLAGVAGVAGDFTSGAGLAAEGPADADRWTFDTLRGFDGLRLRRRLVPR